jgi:hypothetical protein
MRAAEVFGAKCETVSHLPAKTIYRLASPLIPAAVRDEVVRRLEDGGRIQVGQLDGMIEEARASAQVARAEARLTRKQLLAKRRAADHRRRRDDEHQRKVEANRAAAAQAAEARAVDLVHAIGVEHAREVLTALSWDDGIDAWDVLYRLKRLVEAPPLDALSECGGAT